MRFSFWQQNFTTTLCILDTPYTLSFLLVIMTMFGSSQEEVDFIEELRIHPCLWKNNDPHYGDKDKRQSAYDKMASMFFNGDTKKVLDGYRSIRTRFGRRLNKKNPSGTGAAPIEESDAWINSLSFLKPFMQVDRPTKPAVDSQRSQSTASSTQVKKKPKLSGEAEKEIAKYLKVIDEDDEDLVFGRNIGLQLKKFPDHQKDLAKMRIQQVLYEVKYPMPIPPPSPQFIPQAHPMDMQEIYHPTEQVTTLQLPSYTQMY